MLTVIILLEFGNVGDHFLLYSQLLYRMALVFDHYVCNFDVQTLLEHLVWMIPLLISSLFDPCLDH